MKHIHSVHERDVTTAMLPLREIGLLTQIDKQRSEQFAAQAHVPLACYGFSSQFFEIFGEKLVEILAADDFVQTCPQGRR